MKRILLGFLLLTALGACRKDSLTEIRDRTDFQPDILQRISLQGEVTDVDGTPISGAEVTVGNKLAITDEDGIFALNGVDAGKRGQFVRASANGYFSGGDMVYAINSSPQTLRIVLNPLRSVGIFDTGNGGSVDVEQGTRIDFQAGDLLGPNGPYNGEVQVMATWLDPSDTDIFNRMPGDLSATGANGQRFMLETYGMMAVELLGSSGEKLQPHPDRPATLNMHVPSSLLSNAPQQIPLWHFDETKGLWIEEGMAQLQGNLYVGPVSHFSWWNCDQPYEPVYVCFKLVYDGNVELGNIRIGACAPEINACGFNHTGPDGIACGWIWKGQKLNISVYNTCGTIASTTMIDPIFQEPSDPIVINATLNGDFAFSLEGIVRNCDAEPLPDAIVKLSHSSGRTTIRTDMDGRYQYNGVACQQGETISIQALDLGQFKSGEATVNITGPGNFLRDLTLCTNINEFLAFTINGEQFFFMECKAKQTNIETLILGTDTLSGAGKEQILGFKGFDTGTFEGSFFGIHPILFTENDLDFNVTRYENTGGYVEGNFNGQNQNGDIILGEFRATRER